VVTLAAACGEAHKSKSMHARATASTLPRAGFGNPPVSPGSLQDDGDATATTTRGGGHAADEDDDSYGNTYYDFDDENVLDYGRPARSAEALAVTDAVKRYYAMAAREDKAGVCRQMSASLTDGLIRQYGHGSPTVSGRGCAAVMTTLLKELHSNMSHDSAALKIGVVRVKGITAQVLLSFDGNWPASYMVLQRERDAWRVTELLSQELP
jgi:hypothetical protein